MAPINLIPVRYPRILCSGLNRVETITKTLYLSFDDGPTPLVTEEVLELLKEYNAKATFFCKGLNTRLYPNILEKIHNNGHTIGNHSYSHKNAFKIKNKKWLIDALRKSPVSESFFFRPPYGRILPWQALRIKQNYKIIFWDVLSFDYKSDYSADKVFDIVKHYSRKGSIIVFHDTIMSAPRMIPALKMTLEYFTKQGYRFEKI